MALAHAGIRTGHTVCPIADPHVVHYATLGSLAWVHVENPAERDRARGALAALPGVEAVLDRFAAATTYDLPPDRIGDLVVLADAHTVLGKSQAAHDLSALPWSPALARRAARARGAIIVCRRLASGALDGAIPHHRDLHHLLLNCLA